jgi:transcriptional regulator with XRE-family HTH domain
MTLRSERGLTQRQLAVLAGVQQADISRIERGSLAPSTPTLMRILSALGARVVIEVVPDAELDSAGKPIEPLVVGRRAG